MRRISDTSLSLLSKFFIENRRGIFSSWSVRHFEAYCLGASICIYKHVVDGDTKFIAFYTTFFDSRLERNVLYIDNILTKRDEKCLPFMIEALKAFTEKNNGDWVVRGFRGRRKARFERSISQLTTA